MRIHEIRIDGNKRKHRKRVGRGPGSDHGKTACRGHKGQKSRSGGGPHPGFEGGQMPLQRRLPKRGFNNRFKRHFEVINIRDLARIETKTVLDIETLKKERLIKSENTPVKLLGDGDISEPVSIKVHKVSRAAKEKIEAAGGSVEII